MDYNNIINKLNQILMKLPIEAGYGASKLNQVIEKLENQDFTSDIINELYDIIMSLTSESSRCAYELYNMIDNIDELIKKNNQ